MSRLNRALAALALLAALAGAAWAQGYGGGRRGGDTPGQFDFYVLALSWSPAFCESDAGRRNRRQCELEKSNEFVVHGLWPQFERGFPQNCGAFNRPIPRAAMDKAAAIFPDEGLARYEWNKHGTCSGSGPSEYFEDVAQARAKVVVPEQFHRPRAPFDTSPQEVERAFVAANRGLRTDMMSVSCKSGMMSEVRICFTRDLRSFTPCQQVDRQACRARDITVPTSR